ncbi:hypothetical protein Tco_1214206 [Tanacetum coccineum]
MWCCYDDDDDELMMMIVMTAETAGGGGGKMARGGEWGSGLGRSEEEEHIWCSMEKSAGKVFRLPAEAEWWPAVPEKVGEGESDGSNLKSGDSTRYAVLVKRTLFFLSPSSKTQKEIETLKFFTKTILKITFPVFILPLPVMYLDFLQKQLGRPLMSLISQQRYGLVPVM